MYVSPAKIQKELPQKILRFGANQQYATFLQPQCFMSVPESLTQRGMDTGETMKNAQSRHGKRWVGTLALATAVLGGFMLFADASNAKAADWVDHSRDRQVRYTEWRAHEAAERFGYNSRDARYWRHENHEAREREKHFRHEYRERHEQYRRDHY